MTNCLHVIFEWFLINRKPSQNKICFPQGQRIAFNRIGIIGILYHKFFCKALYFAFCQWPPAVQFGFLSINHLQETFRRFVSAILRFFRTFRNLPSATFADNPGNFSFSAQSAHSSIRNAPFLCSLLYGHIHPHLTSLNSYYPPQAEQ